MTSFALFLGITEFTHLLLMVVIFGSGFVLNAYGMTLVRLFKQV